MHATFGGGGNYFLIIWYSIFAFNFCVWKQNLFRELSKCLAWFISKDSKSIIMKIKTKPKRDSSNHNHGQNKWQCFRWKFLFPLVSMFSMQFSWLESGFELWRNIDNRGEGFYCHNILTSLHFVLDLLPFVTAKLARRRVFFSVLIARLKNQFVLPRIAGCFLRQLWNVAIFHDFDRERITKNGACVGNWPIWTWLEIVKLLH